MLDCSLDLVSTLSFIPLSIVHNQHMSSLPNWYPPRDKLTEHSFNYREFRLLEYELKECTSGHVCIDSSPEFCIPDTDIIDIKRIDVVLISNYLCMFALPYLTEYMQFDGSIYVTEPTYHFGKIMMEEMIKLIERTPRPKRAHLWKKIHTLIPLPNKHKTHHIMDSDPKRWHQLYTMKELNACLSKLKIINFSQSVDVFGMFEISAHSSGYCIGSCNWVMKSAHEKVVYMSQTSTLTTHPTKFETQPLCNADVMILSNLTPTPCINPDNMLGELCTNTINAVKNGGNVLLPCYPCGVIYDLIECISLQMTNSGLTSVPIYFLSPVADSSLAYSNILGEWLTEAKQSKVFIPEEPFMHSQLVRCGRLKYYSCVSDSAFNDEFRSPCVVFTSHPSLRFGDVVHFMQLWSQSSKNLLILTEPDYPWQEAILPYQPMAMRTLFCPIDTNWNFKQANKLISQEFKPTNLIVPHLYTKCAQQFFGASTSDLMIELPGEDQDEMANGESSNTLSTSGKAVPTTLHTYNHKEILDLPSIKTTFERIQIDASLASSIIQREIKPGLSFATVSGSIHARDNKFTLYPLDKTLLQQQLANHSSGSSHNSGAQIALAIKSAAPPSDYCYGSLQINTLIKELAQYGITDPIVEGAKVGKLVNLVREQALIHVEDAQTHIICAESAVRLQLKEIVSNCLKKF